MNGLPKGMIPDRDNVVYYDTEKNLFYMILWEGDSDRDIPRRIYINEKEKDNVTASKILMKYEDENDYPLLGIFNQNNITFESELDKKIFFDALDQPDEPNKELIEAKEYYSLFQYIKNKINNISLDNMQNDPCLFGKYATYVEILEFLQKTK